MGFCVATTRKGCGSGWDTPSTLTCASCMASSRAAWVLGGVRLISSARRTLVNTGPGRKARSWPPAGVSGVGWVEAQRDRARQVGREHVGGELHPAEVEPEGRRPGPGHERLGHPGHAFEQHVPADDGRGQEQVDDVVLAHDDPATSAATRSRSERRVPLPGRRRPATGSCCWSCVLLL